MFQRRMTCKSGEYFHGICRTATGQVTDLPKGKRGRYLYLKLIRYFQSNIFIGKPLQQRCILFFRSIFLLLLRLEFITVTEQRILQMACTKALSRHCGAKSHPAHERYWIIIKIILDINYQKTTRDYTELKYLMCMCFLTWQAKL